MNSEIAKELKFLRDPLNSANPGPFSLESLWKKSPDFPRRRKLLSVSVSRQLYFTFLLSMDRLCLGPSSECKLLASLAWLQVWCVLLGEACIGKLAYLFPRVEGMSNSCFVVMCSTRLKTVRFSQRIGILQFVLIAKNPNNKGFREQFGTKEFSLDVLISSTHWTLPHLHITPKTFPSQDTILQIFFHPPSTPFKLRETNELLLT